MTDLLSFQVKGPGGDSFETWKRTAQNQLYGMATVGNFPRPSSDCTQVIAAFDAKAYHGNHNGDALKQVGEEPLAGNQTSTTAPEMSNTTRATDKTATASRKRPRPDDNSNSIEEEAEAPKRARGRPRVDTKDETAAERRRTQIRLAQRAYRSRKDTAINTLEQRVKELERSRHEMTKEVQCFYEYALSHGLADHCPQVAQRFLDLTGKMIAFSAKDSTAAESHTDDTQAKPMKTAYIHGDDNTSLSPARPNRQQSSSSSSSTILSSRSSPPSSVISGSNGVRHHPAPASTMSVAVPATSVAEYSTLFVPSTAMPLSSTASYEIVTQATVENASFPLTAPLGSPLQSGFANDVTTPSPFLTLGVQDSLAHMETTFGRRFQRTATEAGYRLVTSPNPPIVRLREVFGFVLRYENRETIARRMSTVLARSRSETLDYWNTPFTNLGGAGMNYMVNPTNFGDQTTYDMPIGNQGAYAPGRMMHRTGFSMGPFTQQVENARSSLDKNLYILDVGYEGQFFDPDEIEGYLRDRGLTIPPSAEVIDAEIDLNDFAVDGQPTSPQDHSNHRQDWGYLGQGQERGYAEGNSAMMQPMSSHVGPQRVVVRIDIGLLVAELISNVVCLARAPGVRPNDINKSIRRAAGLTAVAG